jgi:hypothetical protein
MAVEIRRFTEGAGNSSEVTPATEAAIRSLAGGGQPLSQSERSFFEPRFGTDLGHVRLHTGDTAGNMAQSVQAKAFTVGRDIVFGAGKYAPSTTCGQRLIAHELAHVVQQLGGNEIFLGLGHDRQSPSFGGQQATGLTDAGVKQIPSRRVPTSPITLQRDWRDDLANDVARDLNNYIAKNPSPYAHVISTIKYFKKKDLDDNVAVAFMKLQSLANLEKFAATQEGRAMLDVFYEAMITGDVSSLEILQAQRILVSKWKWIPTEAYNLARLIRTAEARESTWEIAVNWKATKIAVDLNNDAAKNRYGDVIKKFRKQDAYIEDNIASKFIMLQSPYSLEKFAANNEGRAMLDVLYEAIITGDVTDFERFQADRILWAKAKFPPTPTKEYLAQLEKEKVMIFPARSIGVTKACTAKFTATLLPERKVRVRYVNRDPWECAMFEEERRTLREGVEPWREGLDLEPDKIVMVKLYDQEGFIDTIPALKLIDYANQIEREDISKIEEASLFVATLGAGWSSAAVRALAAEVAAGRASTTALAVAKGLLWADRVELIITAVSMVVNEHRGWILSTFGKEIGRRLLDALNRVNSIAAYYGLARMGVGGARFIQSKLGQTLLEWREARAALKKPLSPSEQAIAKGIDNELEFIVNEASKVEKKAALEAVEFVEKNPNVIEPGKKVGERRAKVGEKHEVVEVQDPRTGAVHCEFHSPGGPEVPCPKQWREKEPPEKPSKEPEPSKTAEPTKPPKPAKEQVPTKEPKLSEKETEKLGALIKDREKLIEKSKAISKKMDENARKIQELNKQPDSPKRQKAIEEELKDYHLNKNKNAWNADAIIRKNAEIKEARKSFAIKVKDEVEKDQAYKKYRADAQKKGVDKISGEKPKKGESIEVDHLVSKDEVAKKPGINCLDPAIVAGILNDAENLVPMRSGANASKGNRSWSSTPGSDREVWGQAKNYYNENQIATMAGNENRVRKKIMYKLDDLIAKCK